MANGLDSLPLVDSGLASARDAQRVSRHLSVHPTSTAQGEQGYFARTSSDSARDAGGVRRGFGGFMPGLYASFVSLRATHNTCAHLG
jgi:hypothetical protein